MISLKSRVQGRYKIEKFKVKKSESGDFVEVPESRELCADWFENLVLDQGLNEIGTRALGATGAFAFIRVGSGNAAPAVTDTQLQSQIASTSTLQGALSGAESSPDVYLWRRITRRFSAGAAAGILAEVGVGWAATGATLFSRALILDGFGSPTTITVLSDEVLDVTYEFRIYPPVGDSAGTIILDGTTYDYTARASEVDTVSAGAFGWFGEVTGVTYPGGNVAYTGSIGATNTSPSGTSSAGSGVSGTYSNNSLQGSSEATWGLAQGNIGGIRSVRLAVGWSLWQVQFSAQGTGNPIPKDNTQELTLTVTHSWDRGSI